MSFKTYLMVFKSNEPDKFYQTNFWAFKVLLTLLN